MSNQKQQKKIELQFKKLVLKLKYLNAEHDEKNLDFDDFKQQFNEALSEEFQKMSSGDVDFFQTFVQGKMKKQVQKAEKKPSYHPVMLKKLFRKIVMKTHPDKDGPKGYVDLYIRAKNAYAYNSWFELIDIATTLGIEVPDPTNKQIKWLESESKRMEKKLKTIEGTVAWIWATSPEEKKGPFMKSFLEKTIRGKL